MADSYRKEISEANVYGISSHTMILTNSKLKPNSQQTIPRCWVSSMLENPTPLIEIVVYPREGCNVIYMDKIEETKKDTHDFPIFPVLWWV